MVKLQVKVVQAGELEPLTGLKKNTKAARLKDNRK
jgi:hypothetical protein